MQAGVAALCAALAVFVAIPCASAAELKIFGSRVTKMMVGDLGPGFEQATGHKLTVVTDVAAVMKRRIEAGEPFDLAVLVDFQIDDLIKSGKLLPDTRADIMKSGIGVAVKRGTPKPDISTVEAFKRALLAAKSITYLKEGASTIHLVKVFDKLGIADAIKGKTVQPMTESVSEAVAAGDVELGIIVIPNILSVPGAELVGPIPEELQSWIMFTGARLGADAEPRRRARRDSAAQQSRRHSAQAGQRHGAGLSASAREAAPATPLPFRRKSGSEAQSVTATALISTRQRGSVASRTTCTVVVAGFESRKYSAHTRLSASWSERSVQNRSAVTTSAKVAPDRFEPALEVFQRRARLALHGGGHLVEFFRPVRVMVIDRRRGDAGEIDGGAALDLDRRRIRHPHIGRVRPVHVLDRLRHSVSPLY